MYRSMADAAQIVDHRVNFHGDLQVVEYALRRKGVMEEQWYPESCLERYKQLIRDYHKARHQATYMEEERGNMPNHEGSNRTKQQKYQEQGQDIKKNAAARSDLYFEDDDAEMEEEDNQKMIDLESNNSRNRQGEDMRMECQEEMIDLRKSALLPRNIKIDQMLTLTQVCDPVIPFEEESPQEEEVEQVVIRKPAKKTPTFRKNKRLQRKKAAASKREIPLKYFMSLSAQLEDGLNLEDDNYDNSVTLRSNQSSYASDSLSPNHVITSPISSWDQPPLSKRCFGKNKQIHVRYVNKAYDDSSSSPSEMSELNLEQQEPARDPPTQPPVIKPLGTKACVVSIHGDKNSKGELENTWFTVYEGGQYRKMTRMELLNHNPEILSDFYHNRFLYGKDYKPKIEGFAEPSSQSEPFSDKKTKAGPFSKTKRFFQSEGSEDNLESQR